jgi:hypothetical protein
MEGFILETHFTSLFINTLSHHQKCIHGSLFNVYVTPIETGLIPYAIFIWEYLVLHMLGSMTTQNENECALPNFPDSNFCFPWLQPKLYLQSKANTYEAKKKVTRIGSQESRRRNLQEAMVFQVGYLLSFLTQIKALPFKLIVGGTRKIRNTTLTRVKVLNTFKHKVRAQRDCDSLCK